MTVSNVINNRLSGVGKETRERVLRAIRDLDYRLLSSGRNLRLGRRQAIGVLIIDESLDFLSHPFISRFVAGVCGTLNAEGHAMIVQGTKPEEVSNVLALHRADADGYCVRLHGARAQRQKFLEALGQIKEPVVLVQESLPAEGDMRCVVKQDDYQGARQLARHLNARGVRSVMVVVPRFSGPMTESRLLGMRDEFATADQPVEITVVESDPANFFGAYKVIHQLIAAGEAPDAVVGINDEFGLAALRALQDLGVSVPATVKVAGYNGFFPPSYSVPSLTTVLSRPAEVGAEAARQLLHHIETGHFSRNEIVLPVSLIEGGST